MITEEMKKKYLEAGGVLCPYCGTSNITADHAEHDSSEAWADVTCKDCGKSWKDIYELVDIMEEAE